MYSLSGTASRKIEVTFPLRASVAFGVDSETFERFEPESCRPPEVKTRTRYE